MNALKRIIPVVLVAAVTVAQVYGLPTNGPVVLPQYWQDAGVGEMLTRFGILGPSDGGAALRVDVASGTTALQLNNGARIDLGDGGADYLSSNGTNVLTPGALGIGAFTQANLPAAATVGTGLAFNLDAGVFYYSNGTSWAALGNGSSADAGTVTLAKDYYVAKNGSDVTGDGSLSRPYLTIGAAIAATGPYTNGYANVIVAPGTYTENLSITRHFLTITSASESPQNQTVRIDGTITISANAATSKYGDTIALQGLYVYYPSLASGPLVNITGTGLFSTLITNCYFVQNTSASNTLLVDASNAGRPRVNIQRSMLQKQTASSVAVVQLDRGDVWLQDVNVYNNVSGGAGAGVALRNNSTLIADRVTVDKSTSGPGIDVQVATSSTGLQMINSTIISGYNGALTSPALYLSNTTGVAGILFSTNLSVLDVTGNVAIDGLFNGVVPPLFMVGTTFPITANGVNSSIAAAVDATKYVMQNGPISAAASSGTNALALYTTGSRLDLGGAANDYLYSNGFVASTPGPFQVGSFTQANLPAAADAGAGAIAYNLDAGQPTFSNGASWVLFSSLFDGGGSSTPQYWFDGGYFSAYIPGGASIATDYALTSTDGGAVWVAVNRAQAVANNPDPLLVLANEAATTQVALEFRGGSQNSSKLGRIFASPYSSGYGVGGLNFQADQTNFVSYSAGSPFSFGYFYNVTRGFNSLTPSGFNSWAQTVNGSRIDLGTGTSDYLVSNGTNASTPGAFGVGSFIQANLPAAATVGAGALAYNLDAGQPTYSNGTSWILFSSLFDAGTPVVQSLQAAYQGGSSISTSSTYGALSVSGDQDVTLGSTTGTVRLGTDAGNVYVSSATGSVEVGAQSGNVTVVSQTGDVTVVSLNGNALFEAINDARLSGGNSVTVQGPTVNIGTGGSFVNLGLGSDLVYPSGTWYGQADGGPVLYMDRATASTFWPAIKLGTAGGYIDFGPMTSTPLGLIGNYGSEIRVTAPLWSTYFIQPGSHAAGSLPTGASPGSITYNTTAGEPQWWNGSAWQGFTSSAPDFWADGGSGYVYLMGAGLNNPDAGTVLAVSASSGQAALGMPTGARVGFGDAGTDYLASNGTALYSEAPVRPGAFTTGSLPSASAAGAGALAYSTTAGAPVYSDGTSWQPFGTGSADAGAALCGNGTLLTSMYVNSVLAQTIYSLEPIADTPFNIDAIRFTVNGAGTTDGGVAPVNFRATNGTGNCDCAFPCTTTPFAGVRATCSGSCAFAPTQPMTYSVTSLGSCSTPPTVLGNLAVEGHCVADAGAVLLPVGAFQVAPTSGLGMGTTACSGQQITTPDGGAVTLSRATPGYCTKGSSNGGGFRNTNIATGDLVLVPANTPRVEYDTDGVLSLLVTEDTLNVVQYSEDFSQWTYNSLGGAGPTTLTPNYATAPDSSKTAARLQVSACPTLGMESRAYLYHAALGVGSRAIDSIYVRSTPGAGTQTISIAQGYPGGQVVPCTVTEGSWTRCTNTTGISNGFQQYFVIGCENAAAYGNPQNTGAADVLIWGAQSEGRSQTGVIYPSEYVATNGAGAYGGADDAFLTLPSSVLPGSTWSASAYVSGMFKGNTDPTVASAAALSYSGAVFNPGVNPGFSIYSRGPNAGALVSGTSAFAQSSSAVPTWTTPLPATQIAGYNNGTAQNGFFQAVQFSPASGSYDLSTVGLVRIGRQTGLGASGLGGLVSRVCIDPDPTKCITGGI